MKVTLTRKNNAYLFHGVGQAGIPIPIDNTSEPEVQGAGPMELLLMGVGACSAIDVVFILEKQRQTIANYTLEVEGERTELEGAKPFKAMRLKLFLEGEIDPAKAIRAADLSFNKYCSASLTLSNCVQIDYEIVLNGETIK